MSRELSVEEIEEIKGLRNPELGANLYKIHIICDLALRTKAAEHRAEKLVKALEVVHALNLIHTQQERPEVYEEMQRIVFAALTTYRTANPDKESKP